MDLLPPEFLIPNVNTAVMSGIPRALPAVWRAPWYARIDWALPMVFGTALMLVPGMGADFTLGQRVLAGIGIGAVTGMGYKGFRQGLQGKDARITGAHAEPEVPVPVPAPPTDERAP